MDVATWIICGMVAVLLVATAVMDHRARRRMREAEELRRASVPRQRRR